MNTKWDDRNDVLQRIVKNKPLNTVFLADLNKKDASNSTLIHYIAANGDLSYLRNLNFKPTEYNYETVDKKELTCFARAACNGHLDMLKVLIEIFNIDCSKPNKILYQILYVALYMVEVEIIKWWFEQVRNYPTELVNQKYLLHRLGRWYIKDIDTYSAAVDYLVTLGASMSSVNSKGNNILMELTTTFRSSCTETVKFWLNKPSKPFFVTNKNKLDQNLTHLCAIHGNLDVLQAIRKEYKVNLSKKDAKGYTPLIYASQHGNLEVVEWLLHNLKNELRDRENFHSNLELKCYENHNALDVAFANNFSQIAKLLEQHGMKPKLTASDFTYVKNEYFNGLSDHLLYPLALRNLNLSEINVFQSKSDESTYYAMYLRADLFDSFCRNLKVIIDNDEASIESQTIKKLSKIYTLDLNSKARADIFKIIEQIKIEDKEIEFCHFINIFQNTDFQYLQKHNLLELIKKYKDANGANGLHLASALGRIDIIFWFYMTNFNMSSTDSHGNTALYYAMLNGHSDVLYLLQFLGLRHLYFGKCQFLNSHFRTFKNEDQKHFLDMTLVEQLLLGFRLLQNTLLNMENRELLEAKSTTDKLIKKCLRYNIQRPPPQDQQPNTISQFTDNNDLLMNNDNLPD